MTERETRAKLIAEHGSIEKAVKANAMSQFQNISLSEAIVLGLFNQDVKKYVSVFGHGTTDIAEVLRVYEKYGLVKVFNVRHETAAAHAVTALKMRTGETAAVITSIGPGAMQAFAGSLCAASNGVGVYHIYGDETTHDEGFNMQQIPKNEQGLFLKMMSIMGNAYALYEKQSIFTVLRRGAVVVGKKGFNTPFFMLVPMNVQPEIIEKCNLLEFPDCYSESNLICEDNFIFAKATEAVKSAEKITIKLGVGARGCGNEIIELANLLDAAIVSGPLSAGIVPYSEKRYMGVGGAKGSISGNYAMNEADLAIIIGARAVCQWDCSGTAWKKVKNIINFNMDSYHVSHYNRTIPVIGDAKSNLKRLIAFLKNHEFVSSGNSSKWALSLYSKKTEWETFKKVRYVSPFLYDEVWQKKILTQPAAIKTVCDFANSIGAVKYFDAGDVQANGFQIIEDEKEGQTITDTGASYMGFATSALLAHAMVNDGKYAIAFCGDGSFSMNPQILIDGVEHGVKACIIVFDNRRMAAISSLQNAQYGIDYKTNDTVEVDYILWASSVKGVLGIFGGTTVKELTCALKQAYNYKGLSLIHVPVYNGKSELGGFGSFGDWNVGNWCEKVQKEHHCLGL